MDYRFTDIYDRLTTVEAGGGSGGGAGINEVNIMAEDMNLDDTDTGVDNGTVFDMMPCLNFDPDDDGSVWAMAKFPSTWDSTANVDVALTYSMNGDDTGKNVTFEYEYWTLESGETPSSSTSDGSGTMNLTSSSSNIGKLYVDAQTDIIDGTDIDATTDTLVIKFTRNADAAGDTYTGTFQLIKCLLEQ